jgi:hypothetical protein
LAGRDSCNTCLFLAALVHSRAIIRAECVARGCFIPSSYTEIIFCKSHLISSSIETSSSEGLDRSDFSSLCNCDRNFKLLCTEKDMGVPRGWYSTAPLTTFRIEATVKGALWHEVTGSPMFFVYAYELLRIAIILCLPRDCEHEECECLRCGRSRSPPRDSMLPYWRKAGAFRLAFTSTRIELCLLNHNLHDRGD